MIVSPTGNINSTISLNEDETFFTLFFTLQNTVPDGVNAMYVHAGFHQTLFPEVTSDGRIHLSTNSSSNKYADYSS